MVNIPPKFKKSHIYQTSETLEVDSLSKHTVQIFMDYNCPFAGRLFKRLNDEVIPLLESESILDQFELTIMNVIQPWHHTNSGTMHEVALAVANEYPSQFWKFSRVLCDNIESYYDTETFDKSRKELTTSLVKLAVDNLDSIESDKLWEWLTLLKNEDGSPSNLGNKLGKDVKYFTRYHRTVGVHVTPTVAIDGIINASIESSTPSEKIVELLKGALS